MDSLIKLFRYDAWANRRVVAAVKACPAAHAEALPILAHLLAAQDVWISRCKGIAPALAVWPTLSLEECEALLDRNVQAYDQFLPPLKAGDLERVISYRTSTGIDFQTPLGDILYHVITHGPYHRGQLAKIIAKSGAKAVNTDYVMFVRENGARMSRPQAETFARQWERDWNRLDVEALLGHFAEDVVWTSPVAAKVAGSATLRGKSAVREYFMAARKSIQSLRFEVKRVIWDDQSLELSIIYDREVNGQRDRASEILAFGGDGKVIRGEVHYGLTPQ